ncbi:YjfB family protein [Stenotrophomonas maltophilia group sp. RNC7]|nr:YjfB family protein [Stenotrophomonas maltophilia group sp. RNC7]MDQ4679136.1 YjfB family protein [Stenotrophomonas maltophilia group sp. RNC7]
MDIAALSMGMSQMNLYQKASISVMKMAMDAGKTQINDMV